MRLFLTILEVLFAVVGTALLLRGVWLLLRSEYRHGSMHMVLALLGYLVATGFYYARDLFITDT
jgi:hypothetical protein